MTSRRRPPARPFLLALLLLFAVSTSACAGTSAASPATRTTPLAAASPAGPTSTAAATPPRPFDKTRHSTRNLRSPWVVVNKRHPVSRRDFRPEIALVRGYRVAAIAAGPLEKLLTAAGQHGFDLKIASAYRSFAYQQGLHADLVASRGAHQADKVVARAGHSEHQTGLAVDLQFADTGECALDACFGTSTAGGWLAENSWRFGFVVRYTEANARVTGYSPEPWHFRFVGRALASELHETGTSSLEEFFGVSGGGYPAGR